MSAPAGAGALPVVNQRRAWWSVACWLAFQLTLTSLPGDTLPPMPGFRIDWVAHFCMYFGLGVLTARAWCASGWRGRLLMLVWLGMAVFGVLDELHENLIPGRGFEWMDWVMDTSGGASGLAFGTFMMRKRWGATLLR
jgi:VanZ family protein